MVGSVKPVNFFVKFSQDKTNITNAKTGVLLMGQVQTIGLIGMLANYIRRKSGNGAHNLKPATRG